MPLSSPPKERSSELERAVATCRGYSAGRHESSKKEPGILDPEVTTRPREGSEGADTRYWVGVASRDHVRRGAEGGFCQLGHGKAAPVERLSPGDWIAYYSPRTEMRGGETVQAFSAIGTVEPGEA